MTNDYHVTRWFRYDADSPERFGMQQLVSKWGLVAEALINRLDCRFRKTPGYKLPLDDITKKGLSLEWSMPLEKVSDFIDDAILLRELSKNGNTFYSDRILTDMNQMASNIEHKRLAGIAGANKRWGKQQDEDEAVGGGKKGKKRVTDEVAELAAKLKGFPNVHFAMNYLNRTLWPQAGLPAMETNVFGVIDEALKKEKIDVVAEAVIKFTKYGEGKNKPVNYFKAVLEDKKKVLS